jgi:NADH:ubiquinone oxidoreductase subunit F (NADH-binding)
VTTRALTDDERAVASELPRLLSGLDRDGKEVGLGEHLARWGSLDLRRTRQQLLDELEASGLAGHGGAAFRVAPKWRSVASAGGRPIVVANGAEGEPASAKDATLLARAPHLVLDGAQAAAAALGAERIVAYVPARLAAHLHRAVAARGAHRLDLVKVEVFPAANAFLAGQEAAVVNALNGRGHAQPTFQGITPVRVRGVAGRPTLVHNVETLAHVALIARFGAEWFRSVGTPADPGTMLVTVTGRYDVPVVLEAALGTPLAQLLALSGGADRYRGALLGGYGGTWVSMPTLLDLELSEAAARRAGATLGPGVIVLLDHTVCPLAEVARVVRYMHAQAAGQCGPCIHGLAGLDGALEVLARRPAALHGRAERILELCGLVEGRGACRHPDGVARFVSSALGVFSDEVAAHLRRGPCALVRQSGALPLAGVRPARPRKRGLARR